MQHSTTAVQEHREPETFRMTARVVGALFLGGMVVGIGGNSIIQPLLAVPDHLATLLANSRLLAIGAMLIMMAAVWDAAHGILMFPILKRYGERIAIGYLGYRLIDAVFVALWSLFILFQIPLAREFVAAGTADTAYLQGLSNVMTQASLYAYEIGMIFVGLAGITLCYTLYRARLLPRLIALWGLAGYAIHLVGSVLGILGFDMGMTALMPGFLWELFIGVWLIVKGFSSPPMLPARSTPSSAPLVTSPLADSAAA